MKRTLLTLLLIPPLLFSQNVKAGDAINTETVKKAQEAMNSGDRNKAYQLYRRAAAKEKNPFGQFMMGVYNQNGWVEKAAPSTACQWFEKAAEGGIPVAQHESGVCFEKGLHRAADPATAAQWYQKAAEGGHHLSLCFLGNLYMTGNGVPHNPAKALELCSGSAQLDSPPAQLWMGKFYLKGDESVRDYKRAYGWFEMAAQKKIPEAFYYLGLMHERAIFQESTPEGTRRMFEAAASLKYVPAYFPTGKLYYYAKPDEKTGYLSAEDLAKAYMWLSAAQQHSKDPAELSGTKKMLGDIAAVMPKTWLPELDHKVAHFFEVTHENTTTIKN